MIYELENTDPAAPLFDGWEETLIYSCLQKTIGNIFVTNPERPLSAFAFVGCFGFFSGIPDRELVEHTQNGFAILIPQNREWAELIRECYPKARRVTRYAIKKNTVFDTEKLERYVSLLPAGYEMKRIDGELYDKCLLTPESADYVSVFKSKEKFLSMGRGIVVLHNGEIVAGASSYTRYKEGIELEVSTRAPHRRKHLATAVCSALILLCLEEGLYPSWDAHDPGSVALAEKLGYEFSHEYSAYEVNVNERRH